MRKFIGINLLVLFLFSHQYSYSEEKSRNDGFLEMLDMSGFLRFRGIGLLSRTKIPNSIESTKKFRLISLGDIFFRNRININISPDIEIKSVFDIGAKFGKDDFSIGSGGTNLVTRDVYAVLRPFGGCELSIGLQPFALPGGYILARDATGVQIIQQFFQKKLQAALWYIKAYDDADDIMGGASGKPDFIWDDIFQAGLRFSYSGYTGNLYYIYEDDRYTRGSGTSGDRRKGSLHWIGLHNAFLQKKYFARIGGIYNAGCIYLRDFNNNFRKINIRAGLLEFEAGYENDPLRISIISEGATGDPSNPYAGISFQDIKASHGFSNIVVDNSGGFALRNGGESCWYGMIGSGISLQSVIGPIIAGIKLLNFNTTKTLYWRGQPSNWIGNELDLRLEYKRGETLSVFLTGGAFLPQRAYNSLEGMNREFWKRLREEIRSGYITSDPLYFYRPFLRDLDNSGSRSMIFELVLGMQISYD